MIPGPPSDSSYSSESNIEKLVMEMDWSENSIPYQALVQTLPIPIYTCNQKGEINFYNEAAAQLWGRHPKIGKDLWCGSWKIYYPDGTPMPLDLCPMAITLTEGKSVNDTEIIIERPDGIRKNIMPHPRPIFNAEGKQVGAVNMLLDITAQKLAEEASDKLAAIVESSSDAIISKTLKGIITSWNKSAEQLFGYTAPEMIGQSINKLIPSDRLDEEPAILEQLKRGEKVKHFETKRMTKDGRLIDISLTISPVKNSRGIIVGASKIARDITAQKKLHSALTESEERLRLAGSSTGLGIWEYDPLTKKLIWSDECKKMYGFPPDAKLEYEFVEEQNHPDDKEYIQQQVLKAMNPDNRNDFSAQYRIYRKNDNQLRWLKAAGRVYFHDGVPSRFIGTIMDITDEKKAIQVLQESEERVRQAVQATSLGTWEYLPLSGSLTWSKECRDIYQVPADMPVDFAFFENHVYAEDKEIAKSAIQKALDPASDGRYDVLFRITRYGDGHLRWIKTHGKVYFNNAGQPERFIGTVLDITKEKLEEQELKDSVEMFQTMADNVPAMIWMSGNDKFNDYFNKSWLAFRGRSNSQEANEGWLQGVHPDDVQSCINTYKSALRNQKGFYAEYRLLRKDGQYRWISDNCVARFDLHGKFSGFISACIDIDDQKRFREKIQDSELLFKTISNAAPVGLWMTDADGMNTFVNDTWMEWTGLPIEEQLGIGWLSRIIEEDKTNATVIFRECMIKREKYRTEFRIVRQNGEVRWCFTEGYPFYDINGEFAGYAGSVTDITEIKRLEERKDDFIKMASHELKTPITSIKGYVQLLMNIYEEQNDERLQSTKGMVKSSLSTISKQVSKLTRLVSELLDLTRIESGKLELHKTEFDPSLLADEAVQDVRQTTMRHAIIVNTEVEGTLHADRDRIGQVLLNLLTNAVKYSPDGTPIEVNISSSDNHVVFSITDHGIGIDQNEHTRIFERFYRVEGKNEQTYPGFGIGLFIASEIIQRHNGTISVKSEKGKGSTFIFTLPASKN
jgi:PAS domain S-box-containing protein